jgi:hypothetical protein
MHVLQARFHPEQNATKEFVVVAHLVWDGDAGSDRPTVRPAASLMVSGEPPTMLIKLQYLVETTAPDSFERLQTLKSRYWSFVEVASSAREGG